MKRSFYITPKNRQPTGSRYVPGKRSPAPKQPPGPKTKAILNREFGYYENESGPTTNTPSSRGLVDQEPGQTQRSTRGQQPCPCACHCPHCPVHGVHRSLRQTQVYSESVAVEEGNGPGPGQVTFAIQHDWAVSLPARKQTAKKNVPVPIQLRPPPPVQKQGNDDSSSSEELGPPAPKTQEKKLNKTKKRK